MRKYILIFILLCSITASAQSLKTYFISMPDSIIPLLTKTNREDCIDFLDSKMKANVKNRFDKPSELKSITDNYLFLQTTPSSTVEMKLLQINDSTKVIGVIRTYKAKASDSDLAFYTTDWKKLDRDKFITMPVSSDFIVKEDSSYNALPAQEMEDIMNIPLIEASFSAKDCSLIMRYTAPLILNAEQYKSIDMKNGKYEVGYIWTDGRFVRKK